jgi:hypothetical protein
MTRNQNSSEPVLFLYRFILGGYYSLRYQSLKDNNQTYLRFVALNTAAFQPQYMQHFDADEAIQQIEYVN